MIKSKILFTLTIIVFIISCSNSPHDIDVSHITIPSVKIMRLDKDIFSIDTSRVGESTKNIQKKYGNFYNYYITSLINKGGIQDSSYTNMLIRFISDKDMREVYTNCQKKYDDLSQIENEFEDAFKHYKYYFPEKSTPTIVSIMSGFNTWNFAIDSTIAISLEMYLGAESPFYKMLALPQYKTKFMNKENIVPDAIRNWLITSHPYNMNKSDFLSEIIYMGKVMYVGDALMPQVHDSIKIQYSQLQLEYCMENEFNIWSYFVAQKLLYTTDQSEIMKYTSDGPFTAALSKNSAPRIGYWVGWQIVKQYMKENPNITLTQLLKEEDAQLILTKAKYKPQK